MAELNLGKVVGSDAKINGQTAITLSGANGVSVITSGTDVTVDGAGIKTELTTHTSNTDIHVTAEEKATWDAKANLSDIPTSLPANGGNADTSNSVKTTVLIGTAENCAYSSILDWANNTPGNAWACVISAYGLPTDAPTQNEAIVSLECDTETVRKYVEWKVYDGGQHRVLRRRIFWTNWNGDWFNVADGGNADTLNGKHASDFVDVNDTETQIEIPSDTNNPIDVPIWIKTNGKRYTRYVTWGSSGRTNVPNNSGTWVWYYFDGNNIIAREHITDNVWTATVINGTFTGWKLVNSSDADTLDGLHANEIASNPNLIINPDFAINQRGETEYTTTGYTVDRWSMQVGFKITPLENGIRICPTGAVTSNLFAIIQNIPVSKAMFGNDYTLTVNVSETNDYAYAAVYAYNSANAVIKSSDKIKLQTGVNSVTIKKLPDTTAYIRVQFTINSGAQPSDVLEVSWAKLELGSLATPFVPPNPATELAKCQRYYQKINGQNIIFGSGFIGSSTTAYIVVPISPMRTIPTITFAGTAYIWAENHIGSNGYASTSVVKLNAVSKNGSSAGIEFSINADTGSVGQGCTVQFRDSDSYIELSAEL